MKNSTVFAFLVLNAAASDVISRNTLADRSSIPILPRELDLDNTLKVEPWVILQRRGSPRGKAAGASQGQQYASPGGNGVKKHGADLTQNVAVAKSPKAGQTTPQSPRSPSNPVTPEPHSPSSPDMSLSHGQGSSVSPATRFGSPPGAIAEIPRRLSTSSESEPLGTSRASPPAAGLPVSYGGGRHPNPGNPRTPNRPLFRESAGNAFFNTPPSQRTGANINRGASGRNIDSFAVTSATLTPPSHPPSPPSPPAWARRGGRLAFETNSPKDILKTYKSGSSYRSLEPSQQRALANTTPPPTSPFATSSGPPVTGAGLADIQLVSRQGAVGSRRTPGQSLGSYELPGPIQGKAFNKGTAHGHQGLVERITEKTKIASDFAKDQPERAARMGGAAIGHGAQAAAFPLLATGNGIAGGAMGAFGTAMGYVSGNERIVDGVEDWQRKQGRVP